MMQLRDYTQDRKATEGIREKRKDYILDVLSRNNNISKGTLETITHIKGKTMRILLDEMKEESKIEIEGKTITRL